MKLTKILKEIFAPFAFILGYTVAMIIGDKNYHWWVILLFTISLIYGVWFITQMIKNR